MWIPDASVNFSIEENLKNVFVSDISLQKNIQCRVRSATCIKLCVLCCLPSQMVMGVDCAARYRDPVEPCALELVGHQTYSNFCLPGLF